MREFPFELALCAHLEATTDDVIARQVGAGVHAPSNRIIDVLCVEPGPDFGSRTDISAERIPDAAIESDVGVGEARYWRDAFDTSPEYARGVVDRAVEIGFFERERRGGREYVRQVARYPDWFGRLVGIENKPDLADPGDLETQLRKDVSLGLVDEVILATESYVTGAHLNRIPEEVGVWRFHGGEEGSGNGDEVGERGDEVEERGNEEKKGEAGKGSGRIEVIREPTPLDTDEAGTELIEERVGRTDVRVASAEGKAKRRRRMAERAYGKGWRTYDFPACGEIEPRGGAVPYCRWKGRVVDPARCGEDCPGHDPADPPAVDTDAERDVRTPWVADPTGRQRRQSGLDRFGRDV
ncbi:DUF5787 family protein [Haladaptatus sp. T7]|uniref:DUF5787 family protein n=1 Tax=Haladaptatus sp. T7 TaxID=2029368 RepID=UPI0021A2556D|nr:DUF5787 family protein [Haladaptatus sp. T7]GKZ13187.1 hypothetical protein HAL_10680 [Haladaptatus sp. T7]